MNEHDLLGALTREGVLVNVTVRYWRASKKLNPEDLGLKAKDVQERLISLGRKRLLPKEALAEFALIESRTHALVERATFPFLGGIARFLPNRKLAEVRADVEKLQQEFEAARVRFTDNYSELRDSALDEWRDAARNLAMDPEQLIAELEVSYPAPLALNRYFSFEVHRYQVKAPEASMAPGPSDTAGATYLVGSLWRRTEPNKISTSRNQAANKRSAADSFLPQQQGGHARARCPIARPPPRNALPRNCAGYTPTNAIEARNTERTHCPSCRVNWQ